MRVVLRAVLLANLTLSPLVAQVHEADLRKGPAENWLTYVGDYAAHRHSPLNQINRDNIGQLVPKWMLHIQGSERLETTPLVYDGVMYVTNSNEVYALDAVSGRCIWRYRALGVKRASQNRGAAILGDRLFLLTSDCHLVALQRTTGAVIWDHKFASTEEGYYSTVAPLAVKDKIIVGVSSLGSGQPCFIAAVSAKTGEELWRFWTVPSKGEPGSETWGDSASKRGGGPTWTTGSYDPELNLLYWPTGNPWPEYYGGDRPGDNLYTDCVLAVEADSGKLKWYFQFTPHDTHDWDANETPVLLDTEFRGRSRKLLIQANRNGFYYVLDRTNGEFLLAKAFVKQLNWATGINSKGRPIEVPDMEPAPSGTRVCPSVHGATNWWAPSINPEIGLLYVVALEQCEIFYGSAQKPVPDSFFQGTGHEEIEREPGRFFLRALDARTGDIRWEYSMPGPTTMYGGTLSTAGGLVFSADDEGDLVALDAKSGKYLWHFYMGGTLSASPMTFSVDGKQFITIAAEVDIFTFGLLEAQEKTR